MRPHMPAVFVASSLALLTAGAAIAVSAPADGHRANATTPAPEYLFVIEGPSARMVPVAGTADAYTFTMPLRSATQWVVWFTDRPIRDSGHLPMTTFVGLWSKPGSTSFGADPPNVAISYAAKGARKTIIATMSQPSVRPRPAPGRPATLRATMTLVPDRDVKSLADGTSHVSGHAGRAHTGAVPGYLSRPGLFVDGAGGNGGNGGAGGWG